MKSYTDLEQSKKLKEILPAESADMYYFDNLPVPKVGYSVEVEKLYSKTNIDYIPCWSLAALLNILPLIEGFYPIIDLDINLIRYEGNYRDKLCFNGNNLIDACYELIIKLSELKML